MLLTLHEYAKSINKSYRTIHRYYRKGYLKTTTKRINGSNRILVAGQIHRVKKGRPAEWTKEKILKEVYKICKDRYVPARAFPRYLYQLCISGKHGIKSVRDAKWQANILYRKEWTYSEFIKCVQKFCKKKYRANRDWPANLRGLARYFCGSIREAKRDAAVILEPRHKERRSRLKELWPKRRVILWIKEHCRDGHKKPSQLPGYMRHLIYLYFNSVREAKLWAKIMKNQRTGNRKTFPPRLT